MTTGAATRTERLMCLVFVLKARGRRGITRAELRRSVEQYASCPTEEAFERMLERDKRDLRDVGVRFDTVARDAYYEDEFAYVLDSDSLLTLPPLSTDELRVLALAARAWDHGTWDAMAHGALHKLEVFGAEPAAVPAARVTLATGPHLDALRSAVRNRRAVHFDYRRPGDAVPTTRSVEPWGLLSRAGAWYCIGYDVHRQAARVFRTSRIVTVPSVVGAATHPVDPDWPEVPYANPAAFARMPVTLRIAPDRGWSWRDAGTLSGHIDVAGVTHDLVTVLVSDGPRTVGALAAAAPAVSVVAPEDLRERVRIHLAEVSRG